jgi:hypothetical protein|tara:strand:- start:3442 stop:3819 length:378 start_codon:yes stop_codon:yes gene_type:complete
MKPIITPIPEVADRYTIALLKIQRLDASEIDVDEMQQQINYYKEGLDLDNPDLADLVDKLYHVNGLMWDAEHAIRKGQDEGLGLEEIGTRAIHIRDLNRDRMKIKNDIIDLTGDGFKDAKMNYAK